jgi:hypothetical protein
MEQAEARYRDLDDSRTRAAEEIHEMEQKMAVREREFKRELHRYRLEFESELRRQGAR